TRRASTVTSPPPGEYVTALLRRLVRTCSRRAASYAPGSGPSARAADDAVASFRRARSDGRGPRRGGHRLRRPVPARDRGDLAWRNARGGEAGAAAKRAGPPVPPGPAMPVARLPDTGGRAGPRGRARLPAPPTRPLLPAPVAVRHQARPATVGTGARL